MKVFDIDIPLALRAVIHAESAEAAELLARQLADRFAGASDCLDGAAYGTPQATEFSIHDLPATGEGKIKVEEAYDLAELEEEQAANG